MPRSLTLPDSLLPLTEAVSGPTRMEIQRQYEAQRQGGKSIRQAIRDIEDMFDVYNVSVDSSGKTIVNFKINESQSVDEGRREDDEKRWIDQHPGFKFGIYANGKLVGVQPSVATARREARKLAGKGQNIRVQDVDDTSRMYWKEEREPLHEDTLLGALQKEIPNIKKVSDAIFLFDAPKLKFELSVARRIKDTWVSVFLKDGKRITLPVEQGEELMKLYQSNLRGVKSYVNKRW